MKVPEVEASSELFPFCPCSWLAKLGQEESQRCHWDQAPILASVFFQDLLSNFSLSSYGGCWPTEAGS